MPKGGNNYAFIDSQNVYLGVRSYGWELDFARFRKYLQDKYGVTQAYLFIGYVAGNEMRYTALQQAGYIVIFKPTLEYKKEGERIIKGNVDAELVLHTMIQYPNFDKALIVSGDGDFHCLIEYLAGQNKLLHVIIPHHKKFSALLRKFRKYFVFLNQLQGKIGKREAQKKRGSSLRTKPRHPPSS